MKRLAAAFLAVAAAAYVLVAWLNAPGFYDGLCPPVDYRFTSPPPQATVRTPPASGHATFKVINGQVQPVTAFTDDGQFQLTTVPGAFNPPPGGAALNIDIKPVTDFPAHDQYTFVTNVYLVTANSSIAKEARVALLYSTVLPAPSNIYLAQPNGSWAPVLSSVNATACNIIDARTSSLGLFAAGYPAGATRPSHNPGAGGQTLPLIVAGAILIVLLAGIPLALVRRRTGEAGRPKRPPRRRRT